MENTPEKAILTLKAKAFDLHTQIEAATNHIQMLESVLRDIIQVTGYTQAEEKGLEGLLEHLTLITRPEVGEIPQDVNPKPRRVRKEV